MKTNIEAGLVIMAYDIRKIKPKLDEKMKKGLIAIQNLFSELVYVSY